MILARPTVICFGTGILEVRVRVCSKYEYIHSLFFISVILHRARGPALSSDLRYGKLCCDLSTCVFPLKSDDQSLTTSLEGYG